MMTMTRNHQATPAIYPGEEDQFGTYTPQVRRASLPPSQRNAGTPSEHASHARAWTRASLPATHELTTNELEEDNLPQTNPPGRTGNRFKRVTGGKLYPRPQSGQMEARRNRWVALLRWGLRGGRFAVISKIV